MAELTTLVLLGVITGFTIYLGLPVAVFSNLSRRAKGMLNAVATGILLFLLVEIFAHVLEEVEDVAKNVAGGKAPLTELGLYSGVFVGGLALGLLGLVYFESRFIRPRAGMAPESKARYLALMIAAGIGFHNFTEGLAIGQSYASGAIQLALLLTVGFALHNATEGFGIAAPLAGTRPSKRFLLLLGLIGGGPTFVGTIIGGIWTSALVGSLFLSVAGGALIYVIKELLYHGRIEGEDMLIMVGLILGFLVGFGTELIIEIAE